MFELLEARKFEVFVVEPGQLHSCGGRPKTDRLDCQCLTFLQITEPTAIGFCLRSREASPS